MSDETTVDETTKAKTKSEGPKTAYKVSGISKEASLSLLVDGNPKRPGSSSYDRFEGYFKPDVNTVEKAIEAGLTMGDIKYDILHKFIKVVGAKVEEYTVTPRGPRAKGEGEGESEGGASSSDDVATGSDQILETEDSAEIFG